MGRVSTFNIVGLVIFCFVVVGSVLYKNREWTNLWEGTGRLLDGSAPTTSYIASLLFYAVCAMGITYFSIAINKERKTVPQEEA